MEERKEREWERAPIHPSKGSLLQGQGSRAETMNRLGCCAALMMSKACRPRDHRDKIKLGPPLRAVVLCTQLASLGCEPLAQTINECLDIGCLTGARLSQQLHTGETIDGAGEYPSYRIRLTAKRSGTSHTRCNGFTRFNDAQDINHPLKEEHGGKPPPALAFKDCMRADASQLKR